jgi:hypothetical protein
MICRLQFQVVSCLPIFFAAASLSWFPRIASKPAVRGKCFRTKRLSRLDICPPFTLRLDRCAPCCQGASVMPVKNNEKRQENILHQAAGILCAANLPTDRSVAGEEKFDGEFFAF